MKNKFKVGDKIKVVGEGWHRPSLIGKTGIIIEVKDKGTAYLIFFDNWKEGHDEGRWYLKNCLPKDYKSFWNLGSRELDKIILAKPEQLEFDFNA